MLLRFQVLQALSILMQGLFGTSLTPKQNVLASVHPKVIPGTEIGQRPDPGKMSVCGCEGATDVNAGPIWNNADAKTKCPGVCEEKGMQWNGQWTTTVQGEMSVCGCLLKSNQGA